MKLEHVSGRSRRAIMLISVLFFSVLTLMFVGAAVALAPSGMARTSTDRSLTAADRAAKSGLDWVRSRISQDPNWKAQTSQTFVAPGLYVSEGEGQVTGWVAEGSSWSRFRVRFNYQDGSASSAPDSDGMNNPTTTWNDFPYVSCNNLLGGSDKTAPVAASGSSYTSSGPWGNTQLTVPSSTMLLSVEGSHGRSVSMSGGQPSNFVGAFHKRTVQTVLRLGNNQPITTAAIMAAGNLILSATSPIQLKATAGQTARIRTKSDLNVSGGVTSPKAELLYTGNNTISGPLNPNVTVTTDNSSGFYKIPANKVRAPVSPATLQAGTYVVTSTGTVVYYNMNYADYVTASPAPVGTPTALPSGMALSGPHPSPSPKFSIQVTSDIQINPSGAVDGFALIPDGGADQSAAYGGVTPVPAVSASASPASVTTYTSYWFSAIGTKPPLTAAGYAAWKNFADTHLTPTANTNMSGGSISPYASTAVTYKEYDFPGSGTLKLPNSLPPSGSFYPWNSNTTNLGTALAAGGPEYLALIAAIPLPGSPSPSPSASPTSTATPGALKPKDLELNLQGGSNGLVMANDGDITIGAQVHSNGSAIVSQKDIALIGTSTDLSSTPGSQLGLNLYAQGNITIDAYELGSSGGTFHGVNLQGVIYAWHNIDILAADGTSAGPFKLKGSMVAYGGDPAGSPSPGTAQANVKAGNMDITYDPSYVASLAPGGPFTLEVVSWHQF